MSWPTERVQGMGNCTKPSMKNKMKKVRPCCVRFCSVLMEVECRSVTCIVEHVLLQELLRNCVFKTFIHSYV